MASSRTAFLAALALTCPIGQNGSLQGVAAVTLRNINTESNTRLPSNLGESESNLGESKWSVHPNLNWHLTNASDLVESESREKEESAKGCDGICCWNRERELDDSKLNTKHTYRSEFHYDKFGLFGGSKFFAEDSEMSIDNLFSADLQDDGSEKETSVQNVSAEAVYQTLEMAPLRKTRT